VYCSTKSFSRVSSMTHRNVSPENKVFHWKVANPLFIICTLNPYEKKKREIGGTPNFWSPSTNSAWIFFKLSSCWIKLKWSIPYEMKWADNKVSQMNQQNCKPCSGENIKDTFSAFTFLIKTQFWQWGNYMHLDLDKIKLSDYPRRPSS
jgi:hypothetical protein